MPRKSRVRHRLERRNSPSITGRAYPRGSADRPAPKSNAVVDCGWGRLIFAQTFENSRQLAETLRRERPGQRDIAFYEQEPHVVVSMAPQEVFLDPSHTFRLCCWRWSLSNCSSTRHTHTACGWTAINRRASRRRVYMCSY